MKPVDFLRVVHSSAIFPFAECVSFLMVIPFLNREGKAKRAVIIALIVSGFILTLVAIRNVVVLGPLHDLSVYPSHLAIRQINIAHTIFRVDILIAIDFLYMGFIKIAVLLYGAMLGIAQLFRLKDHRPLAYPLGIIMIAFSFSNFDSLIENLEFNKNMTPIVMTPFVFGIPFVSLVVAMLRGIPKKKGRRVKQSAREGEP